MYENNIKEEMSMKLTIVQCAVPKEVVLLNSDVQIINLFLPELVYCIACHILSFLLEIQ